MQAICVGVRQDGTPAVCVRCACGRKQPWIAQGEGILITCVCGLSGFATPQPRLSEVVTALYFEALYPVQEAAA